MRRFFRSMTQNGSRCGGASLWREGSPLLNNEQQLRLWRHVTDLGPSKEASALTLQMEVAARHVCTTAGSDIFASGAVGERILNFPREFCAPGAVDSFYQEAAFFRNVKERGEGRMSP